ncbi:MAG: hypothetical protein U1E21_18405 [Reyranellaceae bacterium]
MRRVQEFDLEEILQAYEPRTSDRIAIYLPDKDRKDQPIDEKLLEGQVNAGMAILLESCLGVTKLPAAKGGWVDESSKEPGKPPQTTNESTVVIYAYIRRPDLFRANVKRLVAFLHEFGQACNQGEVFVEYSGEDEEGYFFYLYAIRFDEKGNILRRGVKGPYSSRLKDSIWMRRALRRPA